MKSLLILLFAFLTLPNAVLSTHLNNQRELIVTSESTNESIELAKYLNDKGVVKYSIYFEFLFTKLIRNIQKYLSLLNFYIPLKGIFI